MPWQYSNSKSFPHIFTEKSFFFLIDTKKKDFTKLAAEKSSHYRKDRKLKSDGIRYREIYKPDRELKILLKKINKRYLSKFNYPSFAHCGPKGRSIVTACKGHSRFSYHTSLDVESFFDRVSKKVVEETLSKVGVKKPIIKLISSMAVEDNRLPQGFPTSSLLSTLAISLVLQDFYLVFKKTELCLSLYADDILISSNDKKLIAAAEKIITEKIETIQLSLNSEKKVEGSGNNFVWLGLHIHPWISLPRKKLTDLQKKVYTYKTKGTIPEDFKPKRKGKLNKQWEESVRGKVVFAQSVSKNKLLEKISRIQAK